MKFLQYGILVSLMVAASAQAAGGKVKETSFSRQYGTAGCGLGSMVIGGGDGIDQIFASTTNNTFYSQMFGITFGTLNCDGGNVFTKAENMDQFINGNKVALAGDMARGQGEAIVSLASIMDCQGNQDQLAGELQRNFKQIFPSHSVATMAVTDSIITVISRNDDLAKACNITM
jgi:hypothetical protein